MNDTTKSDDTARKLIHTCVVKGSDETHEIVIKGGGAVLIADRIRRAHRLEDWWMSLEIYVELP